MKLGPKLSCDKLRKNNGMNKLWTKIQQNNNNKTHWLKKPTMYITAGCLHEIKKNKEHILLRKQKNPQVSKCLVNPFSESRPALQPTYPALTATCPQLPCKRHMCNIINEIH